VRAILVGTVLVMLSSSAYAACEKPHDCTDGQYRHAPLSDSTLGTAPTGPPGPPLLDSPSVPPTGNSSDAGQICKNLSGSSWQTVCR
jgi:hypothetical protein